MPVQRAKKNGVKTNKAAQLPNSKSKSAGLVIVSQSAIHNGVNHQQEITETRSVPAGRKLSSTEIAIIPKAATVVSIGLR